MMLQRSDTTLDLNDPNDQAMVAAFETANVFQTDPATGLNESADLTAMATVTTPKYALVTQYDVHAARN